MEKKKLLLVAISVGIFLVVVIGASIMIFSPKNPASNPVAVTGTAVSKSRENTPELLPMGPATVDPSNLVRNPNDLQGLQSPPLVAPALPGGVSTPGSVSTPGGVSTPGSVYTPSGVYTPGYESGGGSAATPAPVVVNAPRPAAPAGKTPVSRPVNPPRAVSTTPAAPVTRTAPSAAAPAAPKETKPRSQSVPSNTASPSTASPSPVKNTGSPAPGKSAAGNSSSTAAGKKTEAPAKVSKTAPAPKAVYSTFWVQTGSFSTSSRADGVKETLASKGITSVVENRALDGKTYYRVRVGPYTSQNEADYWLALIKTIDGFEESQVWRSQ